MTTRTPEQKCLACNYKIDATTSAFGEHKPRAGDYTMCLNCGAVSIFKEDLTLRAPTPEEKRAIATNAEITQAQIGRAYVVDKDLRKKG
jgi:hypothetical protein